MNHQHQICPTCGEGWADKNIAKNRGFSMFAIAFDPKLVNWKSIEDHAEAIAKELALGTPDFPFDDLLAGFTAEVLHELIGNHTHPAQFAAAIAEIAESGHAGSDKRKKIDDLLKAAGVTKAVPAWLLSLLMPLALDLIQKLIEKWFKK
jgi:hypothetical protein